MTTIERYSKCFWARPCGSLGRSAGRCRAGTAGSGHRSGYIDRSAAATPPRTRDEVCVRGRGRSGTSTDSTTPVYVTLETCL